MTTKIETAAAVLAESKQAAETAAATLAEADDNRAQVAGRIAALEAERSAIVAERAAGKVSPDHGSRLALIAADLDGLAEIFAEADAAVAAARASSQSACGHVIAAEAALGRETDGETLVRLVAHAGKLDGLLLGTVQEINAVCGRLGRPTGREPWAPTVQLAEALQRRHLTREFRK